MIDQWNFYLLAAPVVLLVGLSKGGFGGGLGSLAVPLLSLAIDPRLAAAILLPILCSMDLVSLWSFRGHWEQGSTINTESSLRESKTFSRKALFAANGRSP